MDEQLKAAFSGATEVVKSTLSLSTALLALSVTFTKDLNPNPTGIAILVLKASWGFLSVSALLGVITLMAITGTLARKTDLSGEELYANNVKWPMVAHSLCFLVGIGGTAAFGMLSV